MSCITFHPDDSLESFISEPHARPSKGSTLHYPKWWHDVGSEPGNICAAIEKQELEMIVDILEYTNTMWEVKLDDISEFTMIIPLIIINIIGGSGGSGGLLVILLLKLLLACHRYQKCCQCLQS